MGKVNSIPTNPKTSVYTTVSLMAKQQSKVWKKWWKNGKHTQKKNKKSFLFYKNTGKLWKNLH